MFVASLLRNDNHLQANFNGASRGEITYVHKMLRNEILNSSVYNMVFEIQNASVTDPHCAAYGDLDTVYNVTKEQRDRVDDVPPGSAEWNRSVCAITTLEKGNEKIIILQCMVTALIVIFVVLELYFLIKVSRT